MSDELRSILLGLSSLYVVALIAVYLTVRMGPLQIEKEKSDDLAHFFLIGIALQCFHFIEEFITGLYIQLPVFLGLTAWSAEFFVSFNLSWIGLWTLSVLGIRHNYQPAYFPLWFFTLGMILNLIAHPLLALAHGGYFPGLVTSPLVGITGLILLKKLIEKKTNKIKI